MRRLGRRADDVRVQGLGRLLLEDRRDRAEGLDDLVRLGRIVEVRRDQRTGLRQLAGEQVEAFVGRERGVILGDPAAAEDLVERRDVPGAVLAEVEREQVEAEDLDQADHVAECARRGGLGAGAMQVGFDQPQVVEQALAAEIDAGRPAGDRTRPSPAGPCGRIRASAPASRRSAGIWRDTARARARSSTSGKIGPVALDRFPDRRAGRAEAVGVAQAAPEVVDAREVMFQQALLLEPDRLDGGAGETPGWPSRSPPIHEPNRRNAGTSPVAAGIGPPEPRLEVPVEPRDDFEQPALDHVQAVADLVLHGRARLADRLGEPERLDLLGDLGQDAIRLGGGELGRLLAVELAARSRRACRGSSAAGPRSGGR